MAQPRELDQQRDRKPQRANPSPADVRRAIERRSFANLATTSPKNRPLVTGVVYEMVGNVFYINTDRHSKKATNIASNPNVAMTVPIRRLPVGPPATVSFQGTANLLEMDDSEILALLSNGNLKTVTNHGELDRAGGCFVRIEPNPKMITAALGLPLIEVIRDPIDILATVSMSTANESGDEETTRTGD